MKTTQQSYTHLLKFVENHPLQMQYSWVFKCVVFGFCFSNRHLLENQSSGKEKWSAHTFHFKSVELCVRHYTWFYRFGSEFGSINNVDRYETNRWQSISQFLFESTIATYRSNCQQINNIQFRHIFFVARFIRLCVCLASIFLVTKIMVSFYWFYRYATAKKIVYRLRGVFVFSWMRSHVSRTQIFTLIIAVFSTNSEYLWQLFSKYDAKNRME